jgi:hypothetical protein
MKPLLRKKKHLKKIVKFIFIFEFLFSSFHSLLFFDSLKKNCASSVVDLFLRMHAPKIICNFHDGVHVHSKFFGENAPSFF